MDARTAAQPVECSEIAADVSLPSVLSSAVSLADEPSSPEAVHAGEAAAPEATAVESARAEARPSVAAADAATLEAEETKGAALEDATAAASTTDRSMSEATRQSTVTETSPTKARTMQAPMIEPATTEAPTTQTAMALLAAPSKTTTIRTAAKPALDLDALRAKLANQPKVIVLRRGDKTAAGARDSARAEAKDAGASAGERSAADRERGKSATEACAIEPRSGDGAPSTPIAGVPDGATDDDDVVITIEPWTPESSENATLDAGLSDAGSTEAGSSKIEPCESGSREVELNEAESPEIELCDSEAYEIELCESGSSEIEPSETESSETGSSETGSSETGTSASEASKDGSQSGNKVVLPWAPPKKRRAGEPEYDMGFAPAIRDGCLTPTQAAERGNRRDLVLRLARVHGLPDDLAYLVVDNRVSVRRAQRQARLRARKALANHSHRRLWTTLSGFGAAFLFIGGMMINATYHTPATSSLKAGKTTAAGTSKGQEKTPQSPAPPPARTVPRMDSAGQIVQVTGPDPHSVLVSFCTSGAAAGQRRPVEIIPMSPPRDGCKLGVFRNAAQPKSPMRAIRIYEEPSTSRWIAGDGRGPIQTEEVQAGL